MTQSLTLKVTDAGRAALVNAQSTGTLPVLMAQVGVTATAFVADNLTAALPGELKRLVTFGGAAVAADTIHVTIRDDSADIYSLRGFALYLADGTLFASYGQPDPIGEKSAQSMLLLALDVIFADIEAAALTFGDTNFLLASATTEQQGIVELATDAETTAGADAVRAVVPKGLKAALDARFGAGAPSGFVKGLLTAVQASVFRAALAIKGAALLETGHGNGLDADMLDGQHGGWYVSWPNFTGVPTAFPPSAHTHAWIDITGAPATAIRWPDWLEVTGKPGTFPPAPHSQDWSTILNIPATASRWPAWGEVTGKPAFGTASLYGVEAFATAAQGARADTAAQPNTVQNFQFLSAGMGIGAGYVTIGSGASTRTGVVAFFDKDGVRHGYFGYSDNEDLCATPEGAGKFRVVGNIVANNLLGTNTGDQDLSPYAKLSGATFTGNVTAPGYTTAASSRTVKRDIAPCRYGLVEFLQIPWVEYRYDKAITDDDRLRFGSLVEGDGTTPGVEDFAPELVIRRKDAVPTFEYDQFIPVIGRALQQYIAINDERLAAAEDRVRVLENRLKALGAR